MKPDDIAKHNQRLWEELVRNGTVYSLPWLDLNRTLLDDYVTGRIEVLPRPYMYIYPRSVLENAEGKDVLLLASGGGQQSAVYGLLGACVTAFDLTDAQLEADRAAADHHGYEITTIRGDMRDLSVLSEASFDLVYHAISLVFVPDVREVYREVHRVLRPGGVYRVGHCHPATQTVDETCLRDGKYEIPGPFKSGPIEGADAREFVHMFSDIFNGLCDLGFHIDGVFEDPRHLYPLAEAQEGSEKHMLKMVQKYFCIVATKPEKV